MAIVQITTINDPFVWGLNSNTANLRGPQIPIEYVLWILRNISDSADIIDTRPVSDRTRPQSAGDYSRSSISLGELCNVSAFDDSHNRALGDLVGRVLGERAALRFSELSKIGSGWDFGYGDALHEAAIVNFSALLSQTLTPPTNPKLFLTRDGSLEMRWRSESEGRISIFVKDDRFEVFKSKTEEESVFMESELPDTLRTAGLLK
jgi:hypothetical protein